MASHRRLVQRFAFDSDAVHHHRLRRRPVLEVLEGRVVLSTFTVNSLGDAGTGSGDAGDLGYCVDQANADDQANTIVFDPTVFSTPQTITLSGVQLELEDTGGTQTITGPAAGVTISGGGGSRVFQVDSGVTASISGLTITGGNGGGLANYGTATLTDCTLSGNFTSNGGGVNNSGTATLIGCTVSDNTAYYRTYSGYSYYGGRSYITGGNGGGVDNSGTATLTGCTLSGNSASLGAGVFNGGTATLANCTIAGNSAGTSGGGIEAQGTVTVTCSTFARNQATYGGAIDNNFGRYTVTVGDSILAGDSAGTGPEFCNSVTSTGHNLVAETDGGSGWVSSDLTGTAAQPLNALLAALDYYGGPTQTMALLAGSPALGAGVIADYPGTTTPITTDQRGLPLDSPNPDIGAFQTQGSPLLGPSFSVSNQSITYGTPSVTISGTLADGAQAPVGETVAVTLDGVEQSATIGPGGAFSTTFATTGLTVPDSPYTVDYAYAYTSGASFASASATSMLTVNPTLITLTVDSLGDAGIGSGDAGDLLYCIDQANADDQSNTIVFDPTVFSTAQTITLSGGTLELENIFGTQTITGPAAGLTISGGGSSLVFQVDSGVTASISGLTITGGNGGGLANYGTATLTDCTISGNSAASGGGVLNGWGANLALTDCTVSGNSAVGGGGVFNGGTANLTDCTVSGNSASGLGGGLYSFNYMLSLTDTIVAGNTNSSGASDIAGQSLVTGGNNLIGTGGSGGLVNGVDGNIVGVANPLLAQLGSYGGPTQTMALLAGSPALGAGVIADYPGTTTPITTDQRGLPLDSPNPDIGAFQTQGSPLLGLTFSVSNQSITYGTPSVTISGTLADGAQAPVGETVAVTLDGVEQSATIGSGGAFSTSFDTTGLTVANSPDTITYAYTSDGTFASASTTSTLTVNPATLTITADPETKVYGTADPVLTYTATGFEFSDTAATALTGALTRAEARALGGEQAGGYAISQGTLAAGSNYTIAFTSSTLTITPAPLTVAADPQTKVYGTDDPTLTVSATGFMVTTVDGVTIDDTAASALTGHPARAQFGTSAGEQVGGYDITQGALAAGNYAIAFTGSTLTITPAPLTVTANPQTKVYGSADPTLSDTATGLVDTTVDGVTIDDTAATALTGHLTRSPGETVSGGPYAITQGTLAASNYTIHFTGNALTITPATLTIVAEPETKVFGSADPTLAYTSSGFQFSETAATVLTGSLARAAGETVSGSPYAIGQGTLTADGNYTIQFTGSSLSITPATPAVTVSDPGGTDTGAPIAAMATVTGVNGTAARNLEGVTPTLTYYAGTGTSGTDLGSAAPSAAGTYTVVARYPGGADYAAAESQPATFVIAPGAATIALTSSTSSAVYGQAVTFVATVNSAGGTPAGTVTFADGTTPLATVPLDGSGQAALTISTLGLGSHAITASYNGGTDFLGVTSGPAAESVSQSPTAIVLVPQAVLVGKKLVGLTAEIGPVVPGGVVPTGQVTFEFVTKHRKKVTVKKLGTAELSGGKAMLTVKLNEVLKKPLTIVYSGDPDFLASTMSLPKLTRSRIASFGI